MQRVSRGNPAGFLQPQEQEAAWGPAAPMPHLRGTNVGFARDVWEGGNKSCKCLLCPAPAPGLRLCFSWAGERCSLGYILRVAKFARRGNVFY